MPNPGQGANFEVAQIDRRFTRFHSEMNKQVRKQVGVVLFVNVKLVVTELEAVNSIVILLLFVGLCVQVCLTWYVRLIT